MPAWFQRYLLPGLIFESVVVGGGYATGRELVEFFLSHGPLGGLLGLLMTLVVWSAVLAVSFEFARLTRSYDYRRFFDHLLGRFALAFEMPYYILMLLVLSVIGSAAGTLFVESFGLPALAGTCTLVAVTAFLVYFGSTMVERALAAWAILLYLVFGSLVVYCIYHFGGTMSANLSSGAVDSGWVGGGVAYAGYNLAAVPAVLFCLRHIEKRREALAAGAIGGVVTVLPALLLYLCVMAFYPAIQNEPVPSVYILEQIDSRWASLLFQIALFGTFVKTGVGLIHAINERLAGSMAAKGRTLSGTMRAGVSLAALLLSIFVASEVGIVDLIAKGYGYLTYVFLIVFVLPVMTIGLARVLRGKREEA